MTAALNATPKRLIGPDVLRIFAAMMVLLFHLDVTHAGPWALLHAIEGDGVVATLSKPLFMGGQAGIFLFFSLSGYLLYRPFAAATSERPVDLTHYVRSRIFRIFPAYLIALITFSLLTGALHLSLAQFFLLQNLLPNADGREVINSAWTLSLEMMFYAFLPFLALGLTRVHLRHRPLVLLVLAAASLCLQLNQIRLGSTVPFIWAAPLAIWLFVPGMLLAHLSVHRPTWFARLARPSVFALGVAIFLISTYRYNAAFFVIASALILPAVLVWQPRAHHRLWSGLAGAGLSLSYSIYLWHDPIIIELVKDGLSGVGLGLVTLISVFFIAALSHRFVEAPMMRRFVPRPQRPEPPPPEPLALPPVDDSSSLSSASL